MVRKAETFCVTMATSASTTAAICSYIAVPGGAITARALKAIGWPMSACTLTLWSNGLQAMRLHGAEVRPDLRPTSITAARGKAQ